MKRRAWIILGVCVSLGLLLAAGIFVFEPAGRIDPANFAQLRDGMSEADVRRLLGAPSDIELHPPGTKVYEVGNQDPAARLMHSTWQYQERRRIYLVYFDTERKVMARQFLNIPRVEDRLLFWLGVR